MHTAAQQKDTARFWDKIAPKYARKPVDDPSAYEAKLERVTALMKPTDRVLEIGCGTGTTALHLAPSVSEIAATDISRGMIEIAENKRLSAGTSNVEFVQADASEVLPEAPFDVVLAFSLLHLVRDVPAALAATYAQLKPGGLFISKTVCMGDAAWLLRVFVRALHIFGLAPPVTPITKAQLVHALEQAGYSVLETRYFGKGRLNPFIVARRPS